MRRSITTLVSMLLLLSVAFASTTVYVTKTGSKYHTSSCRYLNKSKIAMTLTEAKRAYEACSVCKPPR
jgi:high-affinity K+ transport system ATPase subunit B